MTVYNVDQKKCRVRQRFCRFGNRFGRLGLETRRERRPSLRKKVARARRRPLRLQRKGKGGSPSGEPPFRRAPETRWIRPEGRRRSYLTFTFTLVLYAFRLLALPAILARTYQVPLDVILMALEYEPLESDTVFQLAQLPPDFFF